MENEKNMTGSESLEIISKMIKAAQSDLKDDSFYYLIWGWLVFVASSLNYVLLQMNSENAFLPWAVLMPLGGVITGIYGFKNKKNEKVKTYVDEMMKYVMIAFLVSLSMVLIFMSKLELSTYPMVLMVYGMWLFVSGGAIKFQPLILGGVVNWISGVAAFFVGFETQLLILAAAVLFGYIIPGYLLKNRFRKQQQLA